MMRNPIHRARSAGVGLITAIFLLVVLAGLGVAMVSLFTTQQASSSLDIEGARAYQAARAGIEWGLFQRFRDPCPAGAVCCGGGAGTTVLRMPAGTTLQNYTVVVSCVPATGIANPPTNITSVACNMADAQGRCATAPNDPQYVRRRMEVEA
jgi:MSHA biogenesis protein MshP